MKIEWKEIAAKENIIIENWLSYSDKKNLCMTDKNWEQTASDIEECLKFMTESQFKNLIGYINGKPVCAAMFGIEHWRLLNLYNIVVNPAFRNRGLAKEVLSQLLKNDKSLGISVSYDKLKVSTLPSNKNMEHILEKKGFSNAGFNGEYNVFKKTLSKDRILD